MNKFLDVFIRYKCNFKLSLFFYFCSDSFVVLDEAFQSNSFSKAIFDLLKSNYESAFSQDSSEVVYHI